MPSFILMHSTFWPQYTNVIDRQTGQTTDRWHIERTVLQTVAPKFQSAFHASHYAMSHIVATTADLLCEFIRRACVQG